MTQDNPFDVKKLKYNLSDSAYLVQRQWNQGMEMNLAFQGARDRSFAILQDMDAPVGLNLNRCIVAQSFVVPDGWDEVDVAIYLRQNFDYFAWYCQRTNDGKTVLRFYAATEEDLNTQFYAATEDDLNAKV